MNMRKVHISGIEWDLYDEDSGRTLTPEEAGVETEMDIEIPADADPDEEVNVYLADNYAWSFKHAIWDYIDE